VVRQTPTVRIPSARQGLSLIGGLLEDGRIVLLSTADRMNALGFIGFLQHVMDTVVGPVVVFADNHRMHKTAAVLEFVALHSDRLALEFTPAYAPECNPIELVWAWVKGCLAMRVVLGLFVSFWQASAIGGT
jgi:putative transposase